MRLMILPFLVVWMMLVFPSSKVEATIYWHFTLQAQGDDGAEEWLWVTLREVPKKIYHAQTHKKVLGLGGKGLSGDRLIQVRAKAWRKAYRHEEGFRCDTYLPKFGRRLTYWQESWSQWVFCEGQVLPPGAEERALGFSGYFQLGLLRGSGVQRIINRQRKFLAVEELPGEELKGRFNIYPLEYLDPLTHYEDTCREKRLARHYRSLFMHFSANSLQDGYRGVGLGFAKTQVFDDLVITYSLYRSRSPQHRFFGKRIANFGQVQEIHILEELTFEETLLGEEATESGEETEDQSDEDVMSFTEEETEIASDEEIMAFTEEETTEETMAFTPEEIDLLQEEGVEVIQREESASEDVMVFTEEETR